MAIVEASLFSYTAEGMRRDPEGYWIQKREVERLLEDAHRRGYYAGIQAAIDEIKASPNRQPNEVQRVRGRPDE